MERYDQQEPAMKEWLLWHYGSTTTSPYWPGHAIPKLRPEQLSGHPGYTPAFWTIDPNFWGRHTVKKMPHWKVAI